MAVPSTNGVTFSLESLIKDDYVSAPCDNSYIVAAFERIILAMRTPAVPTEDDIALFKQMSPIQGKQIKPLQEKLNIILQCLSLLPDDQISNEIFEAFTKNPARPFPIFLTPLDGVEEKAATLVKSNLSPSTVLMESGICPESTEEMDERALRTKQKEFVNIFLEAFFKDYLLDFLPWFQNKLLQTFADSSLKSEIKYLFIHPKNKDKLESSGTKELFSIGVRNQLEANFEALFKTSEEIVKSNKLRMAFSKSIIEWKQIFSPDSLSKETKSFLSLFLADYFPDSIQSMLQQTIALFKENKINFEELHAAIDLDQNNLFESGIKLLCFLIQNNLTAPIEAFVKTLFEKLKSDPKTPELLSLMKECLIPLFFSEPRPISTHTKGLIVSLLQGLADFLHSFNLHVNKETEHKMEEKEEYVREQMLKDVLEKDKFAIDFLSIESAKSFLEYVVNEWLWSVLFPDRKSLRTDATLFEKAVVVLSGSFLHRLACDIVSPGTINQLILKMLEHPLTLFNPFERHMPQAKIFNAPDTLFSDQLSALIRTLTEEVTTISNNWLLKKSAQLVIKWFSNLGTEIQQALNRISNSGDSLLVLIVLSQVLFDIPIELPEDPKRRKLFIPNLQTSYMQYLKKATPRFEMHTILRQTEKDLASFQEAANTKVLIYPKHLSQFLEQILPPGTRDIAEKIIQNFYRYARHDLFLKILLIYLFKGLSKD